LIKSIEENIKKNKRGYERRKIKKMKRRMLCPWSFILCFTDEMIDVILNINIFKISVSDYVCEVYLKFSFCMKIFRNPPNITDILSIAFYYVGDAIGKRVNSQQSKRAFYR